MNRLRIGELALASVILQNDGEQLLEVMHLRVITDNQVQHERLHKFQAAEYLKFIGGGMQLDITNKPSPGVRQMLESPRKTKRLKVQHTADADAI